MQAGDVIMIGGASLGLVDIDQKVRVLYKGEVRKTSLKSLQKRSVSIEIIDFEKLLIDVIKKECNSEDIDMEETLYANLTISKERAINKSSKNHFQIIYKDVKK